MKKELQNIADLVEQLPKENKIAVTSYISGMLATVNIQKQTEHQKENENITTHI